MKILFVKEFLIFFKLVFNFKNRQNVSTNKLCSTCVKIQTIQNSSECFSNESN